MVGDTGPWDGYYYDLSVPLGEDLPSNLPSFLNPPEDSNFFFPGDSYVEGLKTPESVDRSGKGVSPQEYLYMTFRTRNLDRRDGRTGYRTCSGKEN